MKIYFDESYPQNKNKLILGCLSVSEGERKRLHKKFLEIKRDHNLTSELKYSKINSLNKLEAAKKAITEFFNATTATFVACVTPYSHEDFKLTAESDIGNKRVGIYVHYAKEIIFTSISPNQNVTLFIDEEERIAKTKLYAKLKSAKLKNGSKIIAVIPVNSKYENNCLIQLCDLLTGGVLQNLFPAPKEDSIKRQYGKFFAETSGIKDWTKSKSNKKFHLKHRQLPNFSVMYRRKKTKKSHS